MQKTKYSGVSSNISSTVSVSHIISGILPAVCSHITDNYLIIVSSLVSSVTAACSMRHRRQACATPTNCCRVQSASTNR